MSEQGEGGREGDCSCALYGNERTNERQRKQNRTGRDGTEQTAEGSSLFLRCTACIAARAATAEEIR